MKVTINPEWSAENLSDKDLAFLCAVAENDVSHLTDAMLESYSGNVFRRSNFHNIPHSSGCTFWTEDQDVADSFEGELKEINYAGQAWLVYEHLKENHQRISKVKSTTGHDDLRHLISRGIGNNISEIGTIIVPNSNLTVSWKPKNVGNPKYMNLEQLRRIANDPNFQGMDGKDYDVIREEIQERLWELENKNQDKLIDKRIKEMEEYEESLKSVASLNKDDLYDAYCAFHYSSEYEVVDDFEADFMEKISKFPTKMIPWRKLLVIHTDNLELSANKEEIIEKYGSFEKFVAETLKTPSVILEDEGKQYVLDGQHRLATHVSKGSDKIPAVIFSLSDFEGGKKRPELYRESIKSLKYKPMYKEVKMNKEQLIARLAKAGVKIKDGKISKADIKRAISIASSEEDEWYCVAELNKIAEAFNKESKIIKIVIEDRKGVFSIPDADKFMHEGYKTGSRVYIHQSKEAEEFIASEAKKLGCSVRYNNMSSCFWLSKATESSVTQADEGGEDTIEEVLEYLIDELGTPNNLSDSEINSYLKRNGYTQFDADDIKTMYAATSKVNPSILLEIEKLELVLRKSEKLTTDEKNNIKSRIVELSKVLDEPELQAVAAINNGSKVSFEAIGGGFEVYVSDYDLKTRNKIAVIGLNGFGSGTIDYLGDNVSTFDELEDLKKDIVSDLHQVYNEADKKVTKIMSNYNFKRRT